MQSQDILAYWFDPESRDKWFQSTPECDAEIRSRFEESWLAARDMRLANWGNTPEGALALVIILDQFPLNMYRGQPLSFSTEALARAFSAKAIEQGFDQRLETEQRFFLYLPYMHSEILADQEMSLCLFGQPGLEDSFKYAQHHHGIVQRFGRFPHRNDILGRPSTAEEQAWLATDEAFHG